MMKKSAVAVLLDKLGKAPGSRKKYTTLLREYMSYKPSHDPDLDNLEAIL